MRLGDDPYPYGPYPGSIGLFLLSASIRPRDPSRMTIGDGWVPVCTPYIYSGIILANLIPVYILPGGLERVTSTGRVA